MWGQGEARTLIRVRPGMRKTTSSILIGRTMMATPADANNPRIHSSAAAQRSTSTTPARILPRGSGGMQKGNGLRARANPHRCQ